jgi:thiol-disulfide isomerase/thioredoxin
MRKLMLLSALVVAALPMKEQQVQYSVSGTYADDGKKIYLIDQLTEKAVDSVVVANNQFSFSGSADKDALMAVKAEDRGWSTDFFNDGTPVFVNVNDSTLKGSPLNERLTKHEIAQSLPQRAMHDKTAGMSREEIIAHQDELVDDVGKMIDSMIAYANKVFQEERNSLIPVAFTGYYFMDNGVEAYDDLLKEQVVFAHHPYLKKSRDDVEALLKPKDSSKTAFIGQQFTDFEMADPDGKMHKISEMVGEGRWLFVDFWASWCGPCRAEMPNVLEAYNKYHAKGFEVVGISFDEKKEAWVKAIGQINMPWMQLSDLKGFNCVAAPIYEIDAIPDNLLIDPQGKIIDRGLRGKELQRRLQEIFGE